jgi:hypothetical protein
MRKLGLLVLVLAAGPAAAAPMTVNGPSALALAAVVAPRSPMLGAQDRAILTRLFGGHTNFRYPAGRTILVSADKIDCA